MDRSCTYCAIFIPKYFVLRCYCKWHYCVSLCNCYSLNFFIYYLQFKVFIHFWCSTFQSWPTQALSSWLLIPWEATSSTWESPRLEKLNFPSLLCYFPPNPFNTLNKCLPLLQKSIVNGTTVAGTLLGVRGRLEGGTQNAICTLPVKSRQKGRNQAFLYWKNICIKSDTLLQLSTLTIKLRFVEMSTQIPTST